MKYFAATFLITLFAVATVLFTNSNKAFSAQAGITHVPPSVRRLRRPPRPEPLTRTPENRPQAPGNDSRRNLSKKSSHSQIPKTPEIKRVKKEKNEPVSLDFDNVDIRVVLKFMSELTNKNFLIDEKVRGKVTILSPKKISAKEAYNVLESILEVHGFAAVPSGEVIKVVPVAEGKSKAIETKTGKKDSDLKKDDRLITQMIPLDNADVNEIKNVLAPLISKSSNVIAYRPTNTLILTDISSNIKRLIGIIKELDVESIEFEISVISLKFASSDDLASKLLSIIEASAASKGRGRGKRKRTPTPSSGKKTFKVVSDARTNSLIVVSTPQDKKRLISLINKLDVEVPKPEATIHVYYLENAVAEELSKVLSGQAAQLVKKKKAYKGAGRGRVKAVGPAGSGNITITADKATNALVIAASREDYATLLDVIKKLDIPRSQVLVEVIIMEVNFTKDKAFGTEIRTMDDASKGNIRTFGGTTLGGTLNGILGTFAKGGIPGESGLILGAAKGQISDGVPNIGILAKAFQSDSDVNILSTPSILTMDNQEAEIIVGEERPFLARSQSDSTGRAITNTYDFKDVGITLRITPHISRGKYVRLELFQEIKNFVSEAEPGAVTTTKRQAKTTVVVENRETIVIGGLISDDKTKSTSQVPCLGNIPVLGWLFKSLSNNNIKRNLMIFITPNIVNNPDELKSVTIEKKLEMDKKIKGQRIKTKDEDIQDTVDLMIE